MVLSKIDQNKMILKDNSLLISTHEVSYRS